MGLIFSILAMLIWGLSELFYKKATNNSDSKIVYVANVAVLSGVAILYTLIADTNILVNFDTKKLLLLLPIAILLFISRFLYMNAVKLSYVSIVSPIMSATSIITIPLGVFILDEKLNSTQVLSLIALTVCIFGLSGFNIGDFKKINKGNNKIKGILFAFIYLIVVSGIYFSNKWFLLDMSASELIFYQNFNVIIILIIYMLFNRSHLNFDISTFSKLKSIFLAASLGSIGYILYTYALKYADISYVQPIVFSYSMITLLLSRIFLKEKISLIQNVLVIITVICICLLTIT